MNDARSRKVLVNSAWLILQPLVLNIISIAVTGFIARSLGKVDFGRFNFAFSFVAIFQALSGMGLGSVMIRDLAKKTLEGPKYSGRVLVIRLVVAAVLYAALFVAIRLMDVPDTTTSIVTLAGLVILSHVVIMTFQDVFRSREVMGPIARINMVSGFLLTLFSVVVLMADQGITGLTLVYVAGSWLTAALSAVWVCRRFFLPRIGISLAFYRRVLSQGVIFYLGGVLAILASKMDMVLLTKLSDEATVGVYAAAAGLFTKLFIIPEGMGGAIYPTLASIYSRSKEEARLLLVRFLKIGLLVGLPIAVGGSLLAGPIIDLIYGAEYAKAGLVLAVAIWLVPLWCLLFICIYSAGAMYRERTGLIYNVITTVLLLALDVLLIPFCQSEWPELGGGALGCVAAALCSNLLGLVLYVRLVSLLLGRLLTARDLLRILAANAGMGLVCLLDPFLHVLVLVPLCAAVYTGLVLALGVVSIGEVRKLLAKRGAGSEG